MYLQFLQMTLHYRYVLYLLVSLKFLVNFSEMLKLISSKESFLKPLLAPFVAYSFQ